MNDLYSLDLKDMTWMRVHPSVREEGIPHCRVFHSMTLISSEAAILFGGCDLDSYKDCWILNTGKLLRCEFDTPSSLWKHCSHHDEYKRAMHTAVLEPISKRLWIIGGFGEIFCQTELLSLSFNSATPLRLLAMESAISHFDRHHEVWKVNEIPGQLRTELEDRRAHMEGEIRTGMVGQSSTK